MNVESPIVTPSDNLQADFSWIPFYQELASKLKDYRNRQSDLLTFLESLREQGYKITPLWDHDEEGNMMPLKEIDPFTFFGVFNRQIKPSMRIKILKAFKDYFGIQAVLPTGFCGVPVLNNMNAIYFPYQYERQADAIERLWELFHLALEPASWDNPNFAVAIDRALEVKRTQFKLTMGLFWIRPYDFISLDETNRNYLSLKIPKLTADTYKEGLESAKATNMPFPILSYTAEQASNNRLDFLKKTAEASGTQESAFFRDKTQYWLVGSYWDDKEPKDQIDRFIAEGFWENGYDNQPDEFFAMQPGDKIIIKNTYTQKRDLPFDNENRTISCMDIKAVGTIIENPQDGKTVIVDWDRSFQPKTWFFFTNQKTIWNLKSNNSLAHMLLEFIFHDKPQDYDFFMNHWKEKVWNKAGTVLPIALDNDEMLEEALTSKPYTIQDALEEGVFMTEPELEDILALVLEKKNVILQGPPGTGKTYFAKKLAYLLSKQKGDSRIEMVQFHQSYSYEDFIRGYRPSNTSKDTPFELVDGPFYRFCKRAQEDPDYPYVFLIDEINRGNLSQIFGELLMLIEADKRGQEHQISLMYKKFKDEPKFFVPKNVYVIGMMNIADRSLAMVDYALRRRFGFVTLEPKFEHPRFLPWLQEQGMSETLIQEIRQKMVRLNQAISEDRALGPAFQVGHSYFCPKDARYTELDKSWLNRCMKTEILPLLNEYWFDDPAQVSQWSESLLGE